jgi:hypothetical protein
MASNEDRRRIIAGVACEKLSTLSAPLRQSLGELAKTLGRRISDEHRDALIVAGLIEQKLGGYKLTDMGIIVESMARGRP